MANDQLPSVGSWSTRTTGVALAALICAAIALGSLDRALAQRTGTAAEAMLVAGWIETVTLPAAGLAISAKLDTGALTSSLGVQAMEIYSAGGQQRVRFEVAGDDGRRERLDLALVRTARIRRAGAALQARPVVSMRVCIAGLLDEAEFTLTDRGGLDYSMLIGRRLLAGRVLVDSARERLLSDRCRLPHG